MDILSHIFTILSHILAIFSQMLALLLKPFATSKSGHYAAKLEPWIGSERARTATLGVIRDWTKQKPSAKLHMLTGSGLAGFGRAKEVKELSVG